MTYLDNLQGTGTPTVRMRLGRATALWLLGLTAFYAAGQVISSRIDDRASIREDWFTDSLAVAVASLLFGGIAAGLALWAARGEPARQARTVIGLTVFAAVLTPISWWNAGPLLVAICAVLLGRATGITDRDTGRSSARTASILAIVLAVALFLFSVGTTVVEHL